MYTIGSHSLLLLGGNDLWEIVAPDGRVICQVIGPRQCAQDLIDHLNSK